MKKLDDYSTFKIIILGLMVSACTITTYYFHFILKSEVIFTHLFYIPIILASLWWSRKGAVVGLFLALMLVISNLMNSDMPYIWSNVVRGIMFVFVGRLVDVLHLRNLILIDSLNRSQDYQNKLINYSNASIIVWDPDFRISRVNQAFEYITGYTADEVKSKAISILFSDATQKKYLKRIEDALISEYLEAVEIPFTCKDGTTRQMLCNLANVYEEDEKTVLSTIAQCIDITDRRQAVEALRKEKEFSENLVQASPTYFVAIDSTGKTIMMNNAMLKALGYTPEEAIGTDYLTTFVPESDRPMLSKVFNEIISLRKPTLNENLVLTKDGREILVEWHGRPIFKDNGEFDFFFGVGINITERKRADEELRNAHQKLSDIIEFLPDGTLVIDNEKKVISWNRAIEEMTGVKKEEMLGKGDHAYAIPFYKERRPLLIDLVFVTDSEIEQKYDFVRKKGNYIYAEAFVPYTYGGKGAYLAGVAAPLYDGNGKLIGAIESIRDITEQKRAEEKIRESEEKYREMIEGLAEAVYRMRLPDGTYEYFSPAAKDVLGYSADDFINKPFLVREIIHPDFIGYFEEKWDDLIHGKVPPIYEYKIIDPKGHERWIIQSNKGVFDNEGNIIAIEGICRDITKQKEAEIEIHKYAKELEHSNELKDLFTDILSHDLLNPAGIVKGYTDVLLDLEDNEEKLRSLQAVKRNNERLIDMIESAAKFAKLESLEQIKFMEIDIGIIFKEVVEDFRPNLEEKQMVLEFAAEGSFPASVNPVIEEVFSNLLSNAIKYSPEGSRIIVDIHDDGDKWKVMVTDFGTGIPDKYKPRLFERFKRVEKTGVKGTGLGLAIVKRIIGLHGGSVGVEDNPAGQGSVFWVTVKKAP